MKTQNSTGGRIRGLFRPFLMVKSYKTFTKHIHSNYFYSKMVSHTNHPLLMPIWFPEGQIWNCTKKFNENMTSRSEKRHKNEQENLKWSSSNSNTHVQVKDPDNCWVYKTETAQHTQNQHSRTFWELISEVHRALTGWVDWDLKETLASERGGQTRGRLNTGSPENSRGGLAERRPQQPHKYIHKKIQLSSKRPLVSINMPPKHGYSRLNMRKLIKNYLCCN